MVSRRGRKAAAVAVPKKRRSAPRSAAAASAAKKRRTEATRAYGDRAYWARRYRAAAAAAASDAVAAKKALKTQKNVAAKSTRNRAARVDDDVTDDWFLSFAQLAPLFERACARSGGRRAAVLDVGCGTSPFLADAAAAGHRGALTGIDTAGIAEATAAGRTAGGRVTLRKLDARRCGKHFGSNAFDVVVDKGTTDAMLCAEKTGAADVRATMRQVGAMLRPRGALLLVSWRGLVGEDDDDAAAAAHAAGGGAAMLADVAAGLLAGANGPRGAGAASGATSFSFAVEAHCAEGAAHGPHGPPWVFLVRKRPLPPGAAPPSPADVVAGTVIHAH